MKASLTAYQMREFIFRFVLPLRSTFHFPSRSPDGVYHGLSNMKQHEAKNNQSNTAMYGLPFQEINDDNFN